MSTVSNKLKQLADTIETLENNGITVSDVSTSSNKCEWDAGLSTEFSVTIPLPLRCVGEDEATLSATEAEVTDDGSICVSFEGDIVGQKLEIVTEQDHSNEKTDKSEDHPSQESDESEDELPPHQDYDALQAAYEQCDTFVEMKQTLETDVTPEAVRQQMVKHGIHEVPTEESPEEVFDNGSKQSKDGSPSSIKGSNDTQQVESSQTEDVFVSDGGFPSELTVDELRDIVQSSQTLYQATQQLDVDMEEARDMLKQLDLLDFVTGRLSTRDVESVTEEEIYCRIRSSGWVQT